MAKVETTFVIFALILNGAAGIVALQAQAAENKAKFTVFMYIRCKHPVHEAYKLGVTAVVLLVLAHTAISLLAGCCSWVYYTQEYGSVWKYICKLTALSLWITFFIAFLLLLVATESNTKSNTSCGFIHHNLFTLGGYICFVHGVITIVYYLMATAQDLL
ncbi:hypothetical protein ACP4OV_018256 [Aristida adscensionis]